ncbi:hypothetical protein JCGZ_17991 [Jatropha curcas]|uniref:DUF1664 domain-containing protein n=1 Tax=Jatropha curcas TaxID=180498 RepID=A0A067JVK8_JATCU|nr:uncharacterized protein LOC105644838 [Jatropha curcas]KDP26833.1 hypothetical protein JCGZ_17991 [Jatropha curcas]
MALPLGKITIIVGAGLIGSVLAKEGRFSNVSDLVSGAFKIAYKQIRRDDSTSSVSKPHNDLLMAQVNSLRQELQMLASSRPLTIVTGSGTGGNKYGIIVVVVVAGYGYVWWKGWKLPDMMFATRRSLSDACASVAQQLENVYASIRSTRRQLSSNIDRVDTNLNEVAALTADTHEKVVGLLGNSEMIDDKVKNVRDAVETLGEKIKTIEDKQMTTLSGVKRLVDVAINLQNLSLEENTQASSSSSRIAFSPKEALPAPSSEPTSPSISSGAIEVQQSFQNAALSTPQQMSNGISRVVSVSSASGLSEGIRTLSETNNGSSGWFRSFLPRTYSATNAVSRQTSSRQ